MSTAQLIVCLKYSEKRERREKTKTKAIYYEYS